MMRAPRTWRTRDYRVRLSDGSTRQVYAASEEEALDRVRRSLARLGDARAAVAAERS